MEIPIGTQTPISSSWAVIHQEAMPSKILVCKIVRTSPLYYFTILDQPGLMIFTYVGDLLSSHLYL
jgi:hypothetical protein